MTAPRTILVNGTFLTQPVTGVQRYARELCAAVARLAAGELRLVVAAPRRRAGAPDGEGIPGCEIHWDATRLPAPVWVQVRLPRLVRHTGADLLWSPANIGPLAVGTQVVTIFDAAVFASPKSFAWKFRLYYRCLMPRLARSVRQVLTISEHSRRELARCGVAEAERVAVVPCGVSGAFQPDADTSRWQAKRPFVLTVGSRDPRKNVRALVRAWLALPASVRGVRRLLVAGGGSPAFGDDGLAAELEQAGDSAAVECLGRVPEVDLPGLYAASELLVYPSLYEGFGLPPLEAMACGTPVLVARASSMPETCGEAAEYFDPSTDADLSRRLAACLSSFGRSDLERQRRREAGLRHARELTWDRAAAQMLPFLQ